MLRNYDGSELAQCFIKAAGICFKYTLQIKRIRKLCWQIMQKSESATTQECNILRVNNESRSSFGEFERSPVADIDFPNLKFSHFQHLGDKRLGAPKKRIPFKTVPFLVVFFIP